MMKTVVLLPAHNEEYGIGAAIESLLNQTRRPDEIVVIPNGCTDRTAEIARSYPVSVYELPLLSHGKSEALNKAWNKYAQGYDIVVCADADTMFSENALSVWEEILSNERLYRSEEARPVAACTGSVRIIGDGFLNSFQYYTLMRSIRKSLQLRKALVLYGAASAFSNEVLKKVKEANGTEGPWSYSSIVEDYQLGYDIRKLGFNLVQTPEVYVETGAMPSLRMVWEQHSRWNSGSLLTHFNLGYTEANSYSLNSWWIPELIRAVLRFVWLFGSIVLLILDRQRWPKVLSGLLILHIVEVVSHASIRTRNRKDVLYKYLFLPLEYFTWFSSALTIATWQKALRQHMRKG